MKLNEIKTRMRSSRMRLPNPPGCVCPTPLDADPPGYIPAEGRPPLDADTPLDTDPPEGRSPSHVTCDAYFVCRQ